MRERGCRTELAEVDGGILCWRMLWCDRLCAGDVWQRHGCLNSVRGKGPVKCAGGAVGRNLRGGMLELGAGERGGVIARARVMCATDIGA